MKNKSIKIVTALAIAAVGFVSTSLSASAQTTVSGATPGVSDLILGFSITDGLGTGSGTNLELDLGPAANFTLTTPTTLLSSVIGQDLSLTYGNNWATRTDLAWGVGGILSTSHNANSLDVTENNGAPSNASTASLQPAHADGAQLEPTFATGTASTVANSTAVTVGTATTGSWSEVLSSTAPAGSPYYNPLTSQTVVDGTKNADQSLLLYGVIVNGTGNASTLGTFALAGAGNSATFTFNPAAVPEPSAYALALCAVILFVVLKRRRDLAS